MTKSVLLLIFLVLVAVCPSAAQAVSQPNAAYYPNDPMAGLANDVANIAASVNSLTKQMKTFVDKFEKVGGMGFTEKQQRLVLGLELLVRTEERVSTFQKTQIELTKNLADTRSRLAQIEIDLRAKRIDKAVAFEGTTETEELREARRLKLQDERTTLIQLSQQIQNNIAENDRTMREANALADRLRKMFLPQVEMELYQQ